MDPKSEPVSDLHVRVVIERAGHRRSVELDLPPGADARSAVRAVGLAPEGVAVLLGDRPVALDEPLADGGLLRVVPTFSGG